LIRRSPALNVEAEHDITVDGPQLAAQEMGGSVDVSMIVAPWSSAAKTVLPMSAAGLELVESEASVRWVFSGTASAVMRVIDSEH